MVHLMQFLFYFLSAAGISRSSTVVLAYLMSADGMTFKEALQLVKSRRYICPNEGFVAQLIKWEKQLHESGVIVRYSNLRLETEWGSERLEDCEEDGFYYY